MILLGAVEAYRAARTRGRAPDAALDRARAQATGDPFVCDCLVEPPGAEIGPERDAA